MREILPKLSAILTISFIFSCAVKESPPGGPEDITPPSIITVEPEPGSTMIPLNTKFSITFSKTMNQERTKDAVFLSPVFWRYPTAKWKGKRLIIIPPENLEKDKTYVLTVGADALGYHGNRMGKSFSFAFSTGEKIDSCSVSGAIYPPGKSGASFDIWAYTISDTGEISFIKEIPDYATQMDSTGLYAISNMKAGRYIVLAVEDKNDDLFWEPSTEAIGLPPFALTLDGNDHYKDLVLRPERRDTVTAYISRARPMDSRKIDVEFSQPVSMDMYAEIRFFRIISGADTTSLEIEGVYSVPNGPLVIETEQQVKDMEYRLIPVGIVSDWGIPLDSSGAGFKGIDKEDTEGPELVLASVGERSPIAYQDTAIFLTFSERIRTQGFADAVTVVADSVDTLTFIPHLLVPNEFALKFSDIIPRQRKIDLIFDPSKIMDISGNIMPDSALTLTFRLPPADTVGIVTARISPDQEVMTLLTSLSVKTMVFKNASDVNGFISYDNVLPGSYLFSFFEDTDGDGRWSPGFVDPYRPSERFSFLPDSISVRSRWETDIGDIELPRPTP